MPAEDVNVCLALRGKRRSCGKRHEQATGSVNRLVQCGFRL